MQNPSNPESRAQVMQELRAEAQRIFTQPTRPTESQVLGYLAIARRIPELDFKAAFEAERDANTPRYRRIVREARVMVLLVREEMEEARRLQVQ